MERCPSGHKELVLKTSDSKEPWVRIPPSPPFSQNNFISRNTQVAIRGSPAKGVGGLNRARVRISLSAPCFSKTQKRVKF